MEALSLYLHVPFCQRRCGYCDFNTYAELDGLIPAYVEALAAEVAFYGRMNQSGSDLPVHTVYFGGGTPSLLSVAQFERVLEQISTSFSVREDCEITIEANPGTVSQALLGGILDLGVNRISLGVQSSNQAELASLDRLHGFPEAQQAVEDARRVGFDNLSLDLIYGIPGQTMDTWEQSLKDAISLSPEHLSLYSLTVEDGTPLASRVADGITSAPDDDLAADFYERAMEILKVKGFAHYEISNWGAVRESEVLVSRHNRQYWRNQPYLGLGAGAHGYFRGVRNANVNGVAEYIRRLRIEDGGEISPVSVDRTEIDKPREMGETMMMGLRLLREGISAQAFEERFELGLMDVYGQEIDRLLGLGLIEWEGGITGVVRLTQRGYLLGNQVFSVFV